jgi:hypothetical protein
MLPWPIKWCAFMLFILSDPTMPRFYLGEFTLAYLSAFNTSSCNRNCCSRIKLSHDLLAPCNSCLLVVLKKSTADSFLTSWWAAQITNLSWIVSVHPGASPARNCKMGNTLSIGIGPRIWSWHSSQRTAYYSRYTARKKDVTLGLSLLQQVRSWP